MFMFILPNGERIRIEYWVHREWIRKFHDPEQFFDPELGAQLSTAVRIVRYR